MTTHLAPLAKITKMVDNGKEVVEAMVAAWVHLVTNRVIMKPVVKAPKLPEATARVLEMTNQEKEAMICMILILHLAKDHPISTLVAKALT